MTTPAGRSERFSCDFELISWDTGNTHEPADPSGQSFLFVLKNLLRHALCNAKPDRHIALVRPCFHDAGIIGAPFFPHQLDLTVKLIDVRPWICGRNENPVEELHPQYANWPMECEFVNWSQSGDH
jgi:hypothetical protein